MNREEAKKLLPIIQAFAEGKKVQCRGSSVSYVGNWIDVREDANWDSRSEYRVAPEVVKVKSWVIVPKGSNRCSHVHPFPTPEQAASYLLACYTPDDFVVVEMEGSYER